MILHAAWRAGLLGNCGAAAAAAAVHQLPWTCTKAFFSDAATPYSSVNAGADGVDTVDFGRHGCQCTTAHLHAVCWLIIYCMTATLAAPKQCCIEAHLPAL